MERKTKVVHVAIDPKLYALVKKTADEWFWSTSHIIRYAIRELLKKQGAKP